MNLRTHPSDQSCRFRQRARVGLAYAGLALARLPLVVRVVDQNGSPHRGMVIDWTLSKGTGTLSAARSTSDSAGQVRVTYTSGEETGETVVTASFNAFASGASASRPVDPVSFTITLERP